MDDTLANGNSIYRTSDWFKKQFVFRKFVDYFPVYTHRSVPLAPTTRKVKGNFAAYPGWTLWLPTKCFLLICKLHLISKKVRTITKEEKIGPKYIFACHPHGVISFGITATLCWNGSDKVWNTKVCDELEVDDICGKSNTETPNSFHILKSSKSFKSLFPGIMTHLLTIPTQFLLPFYRDYIMALGVGLVSKKGITSILKRDHSVTIVVGGAHESLFAKPGTNKIVLNRRKGFIKLALESCTKTEDDIKEISQKEIEKNIQNGIWNNSMSDIAIVPVYVYGENNIHNVLNTTASDNDSKILKTFLKLQLFLKEHTGFTLPLVNSRGIFNYDFGLLPYKRRMDVVIGEPIYIYRKFHNSLSDKVTEDEINYYHDLYKTKLIELWEKNKKFGTKWDENLNIIE